MTNDTQNALDVFGSLLEVGDDVVFMQIGYRTFLKGKIKSLTEKSALIQHEKTNTGSTESRQKFNQIFKIPKGKR